MKHLFQVNLGPVQGFIAASRKTRDLKAGSDLLVEITRLVAKEVDRHGDLIFPASIDAPSANIVLATIEGYEPQKLARDCRALVGEHLVERWDRLFQETPRLRGMESRFDRAVAEAQLRGFVEIYCAWEPLGGDYKGAKERLAANMAGRKAVRDFEPAPSARKGRPMSPLDPAAESVFTNLTPEDAKRLALKATERLDAVSVLKRFGRFDEEPSSTPRGKDRYRMESTRDVALATVLLQLDDAFGARAAELDLSPGEFAAALIGDSELDEINLTSEDRLAWREPVKDAVKSAGYGSLPSYYAILLADGDGMGKLLSEKDEAEHRDFSGNLSEKFASKAWEVVANHSGQLVYSGGDDVLAMLPVGSAVACARELRDLFKDSMDAHLTVGLAFVHVQENLRDALEFARSCEHAGKQFNGPQGPKNALAIGLRPRSGSDLIVTCSWKDAPDKRMNEYMDMMASRIVPRGFPYEVRHLADEFRLLSTSQDADLKSVLKAEYYRLAHKKDTADTIRLKSLLEDGSVECVEALANLLIAARFLTRDLGGSIRSAKAVATNG